MFDEWFLYFHEQSFSSFDSFWTIRRTTSGDPVCRNTHWRETNSVDFPWQARRRTSAVILVTLVFVFSASRRLRKKSLGDNTSLASLLIIEIHHRSTLHWSSKSDESLLSFCYVVVFAYLFVAHKVHPVPDVKTRSKTLLSDVFSRLQKRMEETLTRSGPFQSTAIRSQDHSSGKDSWFFTVQIELFETLCRGMRWGKRVGKDTEALETTFPLSLSLSLSRWVEFLQRWMPLPIHHHSK